MSLTGHGSVAVRVQRMPESTEADTRRRLHRGDLQELAEARAIVVREAARFAALSPRASLSTLARAAQRLGRATRRLEAAAAWAIETSAPPQ